MGSMDDSIYFIADKGESISIEDVGFYLRLTFVSHEIEITHRLAKEEVDKMVTALTDWSKKQ